MTAYLNNTNIEMSPKKYYISKKKQGTWYKGLLHFQNRDRKTYHLRKPSTIHQEKSKTRETKRKS